LKQVKTYFYWIVLAINFIAIFVCFFAKTTFIIPSLLIAIISSIVLLLGFHKTFITAQNDQSLSFSTKIDTELKSFSNKENTIEYSNNLLKLMYRQEDIIKAINFIGNEFNIVRYNYFLANDFKLTSIITEETIARDASENLLILVFNSGIDKFVELDEGNATKISSALGEKQIHCLYYVLLRKDETTVGIAELGFSNKLEAETLENLKMCINELTKF
jgi:hypothetical protein